MLVLSGEPCAKIGVPRFISAAEGSARCVSKGVPLPEAGVLLWGPLLWCCRENRGLERGSFVCPVPLLAPSSLYFNLTLPFQGTWLALDGPAMAGTWPGPRRARQGVVKVALGRCPAAGTAVIQPVIRRHLDFDHSIFT